MTTARIHLARVRENSVAMHVFAFRRTEKLVPASGDMSTTVSLSIRLDVHAHTSPLLPLGRALSGICDNMAISSGGHPTFLSTLLCQAFHPAVLQELTFICFVLCNGEPNVLEHVEHLNSGSV